MKFLFLAIFSFLSISLFAGISDTDKTRQAKEWLKNQPLAFIENKGQFTNSDGKPADNVLFKASYGDCDIYITTEGLSYVFLKYDKAKDQCIDTNDVRKRHGEKGMENKTVSYYRLDMNLQGAAISNTQIVKELAGKQGVTNYFYPNCPEGIYGVQEYGKITIKNIYNGIDWVIYTNGENKKSPLKYDFVVHPQADYKDIRIKFVNAQSTSLTDNGSKLKIQTIAGNIEEGNLYSYQENSAKKKALKTSYIANADSTLAFEISAYDNTKTLVIDPLVWATYYGGSSGLDFMKSICTDSKNNIYIVGNAGSPDFPIQQVPGAYWQSTSNGYSNIFILKFNAQGIRQWGTFYGGSSGDRCNSICVDTKDNIYVTGNTNSANFPTQKSTGCYYQSNLAQMDDAFILKFNEYGIRQWATYYGGSYTDYGIAITTDSHDNIYITGNTNSSDFPTQQFSGSFYQSSLKGYNNVFILKFNNQCALEWATYYGGNDEDNSTAICVDLQDNVYITGGTYSRDFPTQTLTGAYNQSSNTGNQDIFILKINKQGIRLWATYYGGSGNECGYSVCTDSQNNIYISGSTYSANFPIQQLIGAFNTSSNGGGKDLFILKYTSQNERIWATYYGGSGDDIGYSICCDSQDNLYITGSTESFNFPTQALLNEYYQPLFADFSDAFLLLFNRNGAREWATYYGGVSWDNGAACAVDHQNSFYAIGNLGLNAYTIDYGHGAYFNNSYMTPAPGFILKVASCPVKKPTSVQTDRNNLCIHDNGNIILTAIAGEGDTLKWYSDNLGLNYIGKNTPLVIPSPIQTTTYYARWESTCDTSACESIVINIYPQITKNISPIICQGDTCKVGISKYTTAGTYTDVLKTYLGCDSTVVTNLVVNPTKHLQLTHSICQGDSYVVGPYTHNTTGIYSDTLTSAISCDSIVTTNLVVNPTKQTPNNPIICEGELVKVGVHTYTITGTYVDKLSTSFGCDSIVTTNLIVGTKKQSLIIRAICQGESFPVGNNTYTKTGTYTDVLQTMYGCDSVVTTNLIVDTKIENHLIHAICEGENFPVGTHIYTTTGVYTDNLIARSGCDSIVTLDLIVNPVPAISLGNDLLLCPGDSVILSPGTGFTRYEWSDGSFLSNLKVTSPGDYSVTVFNEWCSSTDAITVSECESELWFPNAFSPNLDGLNEFFKPVILGTLVSYQITMYNRWGQQIYSSTDAGSGWDGTIGGKPCENGLYVYTVSYSIGREPLIKQNVKRGSVTLLR